MNTNCPPSDPTTYHPISSKTSLSCSSGDEEDLEPGVKAVREKERRQANNARERYRDTDGMWSHDRRIVVVPTSRYVFCGVALYVTFNVTTWTKWNNIF